MPRRSLRNRNRDTNEPASKSNDVEMTDEPAKATSPPRTRTRATAAATEQATRAQAKTQPTTRSKQNLGTRAGKRAALMKTTDQGAEPKASSLSVSDARDNEEDVQINGSSDRLLAIERLMAALRESELGTDLDNGSSKLHKRRTASSSSGSDSDDSEFEQASASDEESVGGESERIGDAADKELEKKEKKFILRFKMAESRDKGASNRQLKAGDIDWSDFDIETINEILARREELNRVKRMAMGEQAHESRTSRLKKSSLAPAPLNLRKSRPGKNARPRDDIEEGEEVEDQEMEYQDKDGIDEGEQPSSYGEEQQREQQHEPQEEEEEEDQNRFAEAEPEDSLDKMDIDTEELGELFEDIDEADVLVQGQMALHLPPRASVHTEEVGVTEQASDVGQQQRELRPHPAMARGSGLADTVQTGPPKDMRLELQNELQREERLLKDLKAEIVDKLFKLQAEEKLLRMIVKHDFDIPQDEAADDLAGPAGIDTPAYGAFSEIGNADQQSDYAAAAAAAAAAMAAATQSGLLQDDDAMESDSDASSLSGMSSSSSEDEVQDEEITRGALSRVLKQYLPDEE